MNSWLVPGAPLEGGRGWRIWFSRADGDTAPPAGVKIEQAGVAVPFTQTWLPRTIPGLPRSFGVLKLTLTNPSPGATYRVHIPEARDTSVQPMREGWFDLRSLPASLPPEGLGFLIASCFWRDDDQSGGGYAAAVQHTVKKQKPAFKLLIGDQVYQDWPPSWWDPGRSALELYAARYEAYWGAPGYQDVLRTTPTFFLCDDHEFWNDYPERQFQLARTYTDASRKEHGAAAADLYRAYQRSANPGGVAWFSFEIKPVSFFIADTRSQRTPVGDKAKEHFFSQKQWDALEAWFHALRGPGVLVLGQPFFQDDGDFKDHSLSNFERDYERLGKLICDSHAGHFDNKKPHQILILSGDIHCGRVSRGLIAGAPGHANDTWEFITSPVSRIEPYIRTPKPEQPRAKVAGAPVGGHRIDVQLVEVPPSAVSPGSRATIHNNVGLVHMTPIGSDRVRFDLSLRCVRPYSHVHAWEFLVDKSKFPPPLAEVLQKEITLS